MAFEEAVRLRAGPTEAEAVIPFKAAVPLTLAIAGAVGAWATHKQSCLKETRQHFQSALSDHSGMAVPARILDASWTTEGALKVLQGMSAQNEQVVFDGQSRLCLIGALESAYDRIRPSSATILLYELSSAKGWRTGVLWDSARAGKIVDATFDSRSLLVNWLDLDGSLMTTAIPWESGRGPDAGQFHIAARPGS